MKAISLSGLAVLAATTGALAGQPPFATAASMNYYDLSPKPIPGNTAIMGERDPNYITLTGEPFGFFEVYGIDNSRSVGRDFGRLNAGFAGMSRIPFRPIAGQLDSNGQAQIQMPYGSVQEQTSFTLFASIDNGSPTPTQLTTDILVFRSMAGFLELPMPAGSLAHSRGCLMGMDIATRRIWIGNIEYTLDIKTDFANFTALDELVVGETWLNVNGRYNGVGGFTANEVGLEDMEPYTRLEGRVQGMGPSGLVIMDVSAYISPQTIIIDHDTGAPRTFADVDLFMPVEIWVDTNSTMYPHIIQMSINTPIEPEPEPEPESEDESEDPPPPFCG